MGKWILRMVLRESNEVKKLKKTLEAEGWKIEDFYGDGENSSGGALKENSVEAQRQNCLVMLTDQLLEVSKAVHANLPVIYYERPGNVPIYDADMTVLSLEELDGDFFKKVFQRHYHLPWTILETERLIIRESTLKDFEGLLKLYMDASALRWAEDEAFCLVKDMQENVSDKSARFEAYLKYQYPYYGYGLYTVLLKESKTIVARIGFGNREYKGKVYLELGYLVGKPYRNQGIASEAALALAGVMEDLTGEKRAAIFCSYDNLPSRQTAEKICRLSPEHFQLILI